VTKADFEPYDDAPVVRQASRRSAVSPTRVRRGEAGVVIVGAGRAGWQMATALRERDADLPITMVSACAASLYDKPQLSVVQARQLSADALVKECGRDAAERLGVRLLAKTDAIHIDAGTSSLRTTRGTLRYRHLVLAHGAEPRAVPQLPSRLCWRINHLEAYLRFREALGAPCADADAGVAIVGAGLVGCELANDLALAGHRVTLLEVESRPLAALLAPDRSAALLAAWRDLPVRFEGGVRVRSVRRGRDTLTDASRIVVASEDGRSFVAAQVIAATGLETCSRLAASAGLAWNHGIAVDPTTLATNVENIHALGDCISIDGTAHRFIEPIGRQARLIADRIAGRETEPYVATRPPIRIKTSSLAFTVAP
jgi:rubredoxin-NAD+ reductase